MSLLPKFSSALALSVPLVSLVAVQSVDAAIYMKFGDIKGESTDSNHIEWADIESFSWGIACEPTSPTGGGGTTVKPLVITKRIDKSSPLLMLSCGTGQPIPEVTLELEDPSRNGGDSYYKITFEDVIVSSFQSGPTDGDSLPTESVSFNYTKITWTYYPADGSPPVEVTRDFNPDPVQ